MADVPSTPASQNGKPTVTISDKSREMLTQLRQVLDDASDEAIKENELYAGRIITDLLDQVEAALNRVNSYTKRVNVAAKRKTIKSKRKQMRGTSSVQSA